MLQEEADTFFHGSLQALRKFIESQLKAAHGAAIWHLKVDLRTLDRMMEEKRG